MSTKTKLVPRNKISLSQDPYASYGTTVVPGQVSNNGGGVSFTVSPLEQLERFLILGTEGGTYYVGERELTEDNAKNITAALKQHGKEAVDLIVDVSVKGRAHRVNSAIFALAVACSFEDDDVRSYALARIGAVCRTFTHLTKFLTYVQNFRSLGTGITKALARWYTDQPVDKVAYQAVKYRNRDGWTHRDVLRISHPKADTLGRAALFNWIVGNKTPKKDLPNVVRNFKKAQKAETVDKVIEAINRKGSIPWEAIPTGMLNEREVWDTLLDNNSVGITALIRQLPRLTNLGLDKDKRVLNLLQSEEALKNGRVHPIQILTGMKSYTSGATRSGVTYHPSRHIIDALDEAFYASVGFVEPTGKRTLVALDVSGSMTWNGYGNNNILTPRDISAAMSLITARVEDDYTIVAFSRGITQLAISPRQRLDDVVATISDLPFDYTNCGLPMRWALEQGLEYDAFIVWTDNEHNGKDNPSITLQQYRNKTGIDAKFVACATATTEFSIADPNDYNSLSIVGFDASVPHLISKHVTS